MKIIINGKLQMAFVSGALALSVFGLSARILCRSFKDINTLANAYGIVMQNADQVQKLSVAILERVGVQGSKAATMLAWQADSLRAVADDFVKASTPADNIQLYLDQFRKEKLATERDKERIACATAINNLPGTKRLFDLDEENLSMGPHIPKACTELFKRVEPRVPKDPNSSPALLVAAL